jgi:aryl-alcohol dehydrogenase-like predicted oxidoreductase
MRLCLGTVQFGLKYGIAGNEQPNLSSCVEMLDYAYQNGITTFDTASAYGTAEDVLGEFIKQKAIKQSGIEIISKIKPDIFKEENRKSWYSEAKNAVTMSIKKLNVECLDGYMLHNASKIYDEEVIETLFRLKKEGYVKRIGASVYNPDEANKTFSYRDAEIVQLPYNIFDQRLDREGFFKSQIITNKKIYARSAYLKGLLLMPINEIPAYLAQAVPLVKRFDELCKEYGISRELAAINFVKSNRNIDYLVFGVDSIKQLKVLIEMFNTVVVRNIIEQIGREF